jgi:hypothetical protein
MQRYFVFAFQRSSCSGDLQAACAKICGRLAKQPRLEKEGGNEREREEACIAYRKGFALVRREI